MEFFVTWLMFSLAFWIVLELAVDTLKANTRKVGGLWFLRLGRLQFSFCLCKQAKPLR